MTLRRRFVCYLLLLHAAGLGVAVWFVDALGYAFFAIEAALLLSLWMGYRLAVKATAPLDFVTAFADVLDDREFSARFSTVGMPEMDSLVRAYNRMLETLYHERLRLGEQRGFVERFLEATPVGVVVLDFDRRINLLNAAAARFLDAAAEELPGRRLGQLGSELATRLAALPVGGSELIQLGGARRFRIEHEVFRDRGFDRSFMVIEELTTVLNESERAAYQKLIRLMSHEVNNTIAATNSLLESCTHYAPQLTAEDQQDFLQAISVVMKRNQHLNHFMRDFAQIVRLPSPRPEPVDLNELLASLQVMFSAECQRQHVLWQRSGERDLPPVRLDPEQMEQALINIVKNALEAIGETGSIEVTTTCTEGHVRLAITDDGGGIPPEIRPELFTPFYSTKPNGQGLGLTLVKEILLKHGFDFAIDSAAGRTTFRIDLATA